ncbi:flagellar biosynthesis protein FlhF [Desulfoscipio geothermicus]|uniref:Flagellar biosynthesis protein FlhF n=1 Tax=Desulfoscipio geothermicus DSM 3669 TaxID=1121426 RepID=A0A1I6CV52_9FIRM|nr:flagellar biosynthesis protein FlhF [Desulfoscipio geothermicus]SFQ97115.1 flagellar biosynthesis protein FlhF [Desulfoscipio geothermicus DSM 3669]
MKIKKFVAADMQQILQQVRRELGEDAVIISTQKEPIRSIKHLFGQRQIEVTAAVDEVPDNNRSPQSISETQPPPLLTGGPDNKEKNNLYVTDDVITPPRIIPGRLIPAKLPEPIMQIAGKEHDNWFKVVLEREMDKEESVVENGLVGKWKKILRQMEVNDSVIEKLFKELDLLADQEQEVSEDIFLVHLKKEIINLLKLTYNKVNTSRIYTFIGPTGVGKTLTLAKLATRMKVMEKKQIALISVFNHRFGAVDKLNFYGDIIGTPVEVVMTPGELSRAVEAHRDKDFIFIDTEGKTSKNQSQVLELQTFVGAVNEPQHIFLVLSTAIRNRDVLRIANDFMPIGYNQLIMTKMDETDTFGTMLNLACNTGLPVAYATNGQNVPDDIEKVTPKRFAEILLGGVVLDEDSET